MMLDPKALESATDAVEERLERGHATEADIACAAIRAYLSALPSSPVSELVMLDPDMPAQQMRLHMGEMTAQEMRTARAAIRWANSALSTITPAEVGWLAGGLRSAAGQLPYKAPAAINYRRAATALEAQAAELAAVKANCETVCNSYADENQRLHDRAERAEAGERAAHDAANTAIRQRDEAHAHLAEARKALEMMLKEHDILSGNFGDVMDPKHKRPDRWPTAAEAARRALTGEKDDG